MVRRWSMGVMAALVVAIATALSVAASSSRESHWSWAVHVSAYGVELSATSEHARVLVQF